MNVIILMAGSSADFEKHGHAYPKYLLEIQGKPIIQRIIESLLVLNAKLNFVLKKEDDERFYLASTIKILCPDAKVYLINNMTKGASCSALFAIDDINNDEELIVLNGDQLITSDFSSVISNFRARNLDGGLICFRSVHPRWSYVSLDEKGCVNETSEKRPISDLATAGFYYFKKGCDFVNSVFDNIRKDVNYKGKYYVCSTYNELILRNKSVGVFEIEKKAYISFSTPQMYDNYINHKND